MGELVAEGFHISQRLRRLNRVQLPFQPSAPAHSPYRANMSDYWGAGVLPYQWDFRRDALEFGDRVGHTIR